MRAPRPAIILACCGVAIAVALALATDLRMARWVTRLSADGSPPPAADAASPTGYVAGQRYFLGLHERGDTYRWIAATQRLLAVGPLASSHYESDNAPVGRHELLPRLYAGWIAGIAWVLHLGGGESVALAVERAAIWEPVVCHLLLLLATAWFLARRFGPGCATTGALLIAIFPLLSDQFLPGTLSPRPWALFLAAYAIAVGVLARGQRQQVGRGVPPNRVREDESGSPVRATVNAAVAAALALWLDPEIGFPVILIGALGAAIESRGGARRPGPGVGCELAPNSSGVAVGSGCEQARNQRSTAGAALRWSVVGAAVTTAAWWVDRAPAGVAVGELRYVHPCYALAWLGLGLALHVWLRRRDSGVKRAVLVAEAAGALLLMTVLVFAQLKHGYRGWLFPSAAMSRLTSLDETVRFTALPAWLRSASPLEMALLGLPTIAGIAVTVSALKRSVANDRRAAVRTAAVYGALLVLAFFKVRWLVVTSLIAVPLVWECAAQRPRAARLGWVAGGVAFFAALVAWHPALPTSLRKPDNQAAATAADLEALVARQFSHWLVSHAAGRPVSALAPPELSDSLVFHGGCRALMSTAWESFDGQVAASRFLSAPEATEAEAILQSREATHVILPSWDGVLPLLVREPKEAERTTMYARLQRWILPPYLRPLAYRLPPIPGFETQKLAVFKVTSSQDEALLLSRLAEYFAEVDRPEPAALAAKVLGESFANDPNAVIARAIVDAASNRMAEFNPELDRLVAAPTAGEATLPWDRRVQRAIVFALGQRGDLAKSALARCLADVSAEQIAELTPLEAHRLLTLMKAYGLDFTKTEHRVLVSAMAAEYGR